MTVTSREITAKGLDVLARILDGMPRTPKPDGVHPDRLSFHAGVADRRMVPFAADEKVPDGQAQREATPARGSCRGGCVAVLQGRTRHPTRSA